MKGLKEATEVGRVFADSEYGQKLNSEIRWKKYKPAEMPDQQWIEILGRDANNLEHMSLMQGITVAFIRHSEQFQPDLLTDEEKELLLLVAISHDNGEAITTDVSYGDKTAKNEREEQLAYDAVVSEVFPDDANRMKQLKDIIFDHKADKSGESFFETKLGEIFFAIECLGYMRTALIAADTVTDETISEDIRENLIWLVADVIGGLTVSRHIMNSIEKYTAVRNLLTHYASELDTAYELVNSRPTVFLKYKDGDEVNKKTKSFLSSRRNWLEFRKGVS